MRTPRINDLGKDPVLPLFFRLAAPAVCAQLVNALYNVVDRVYIARIPEVGSLALTGLGICFPVLMVILALTSLIGAGGGARAAIAMGEEDIEKANRILGSCTAAAVMIAIVVTVVLELIKTPMLYLFGASDATIGYAVDYLTVYLAGTVFVMLATGLNNFISTQGFSTQAMLTILIGAGLNILLDPLFIFVFDMGVQGAALATILSQAVSAVWVVRFLTGSRTRLRIQRKYLRPDPKILLPVLAIGVSPFVMQSTESLLNIAFNSSLQKFGGDLAVGAMTVCTSVGTIFLTAFQGFAQGSQPIVGYNYGAGNFDRVKKSFRILFLLCLSLSVLAWLASRLFPKMLVSLFTEDPALRDYAMWALGIYMAGYFIIGLQMSCQQTFVALGQAKISLFLAVLRKLILLIPLIYLLPLFLENKVFAVFLAEPIADILAATTTSTIFAVRFPRILKRRRQELEQRSLQEGESS